MSGPAPLPAIETRLHRWVPVDSRETSHYCGDCRVVRYPNGKLDAQACPGAPAPSIKPSYASKRKAAVTRKPSPDTGAR